MKNTTTIAVYDIDNRKIGETQPSKITLEPNRVVYTSAVLPLSHLTPGIYRVDLLLGTEPAWRAFFRITE
jgi:hypothetical protein